MSTVLRTYIRLLVEKIRSKTDPMGNKFDMKKFTSLKSNEDMLAYASMYLEKLGEGSSRVVFALTSWYALKIALNEKGLAQNEAEVDIYTNPKTQPIVAKIHKSDPSYRWIITDLVRPLRSEEEFKSLVGLTLNRFISQLWDLKDGVEFPRGQGPHEFTRAVFALMSATGLIADEPSS